MKNEHRDYSREVKNMLKNKTMKDVRQVGGGYAPMSSDLDSVESLLQFYEGQLGGQSIHKILNEDDDALVHKTLMGVVSGNGEVDDSMLVLKNEIADFTQNTSYKDANALIESAKKGFENALIAKQSRIDSINAEFEKVKLEFYQFQNHMRGWEIKEYQDKIYGYEALVQDYDADPKVALINEKLKVYQHQYALGMAKVRKINEDYADELAEIRHQEIKRKLADGEI